MSNPRRLHTQISVAIALMMAITTGVAAQKKSDPTTLSHIKIKNFGQVDERFYRGAQPKAQDFKDLAALGVKTVINLREGKPRWEKQAVEAAGMRYISIPMNGRKYPPAETVEAFLKLVDDPNTGKFFLHCAGGKHRTGVLGAVYRVKYDHWNFDQTYAEMKSYKFYTIFGHGVLKDFVRDYSNENHLVKAKPAAATASGSQ